MKILLILISLWILRKVKQLGSPPPLATFPPLRSHDLMMETVARMERMILITMSSHNTIVPEKRR